MVNFDFATKCYSCGACKSVCPKNAIQMTGNCFPVVKGGCVNCGVCEIVCPYMNEMEYTSNITGKSFVCRNKDIEIRKNSSSGGVFQLLAFNAINSGWYVCGCVYDSDFMPQHIVTNQKDDIFQMLGSKYVKSDLSAALEDINRLVKSEKKILFSGTPCQIAAIRNLYPQNKNIFCVGVVCHGSIERDIWKEYLEAESRRGKIKSVTMRDKAKGWLNYGLKFTFENNSEHITYRKEDGYFLRAFTDGLLERDRCLTCSYKGDRILADLLLGDAWGMEQVHPELLDEWGLSGVICITEWGIHVFQDIAEKMDYAETDINLLIERNQRIISPARVDPRYKTFRNRFEAQPKNIQELCEKYEKQTVLNRILSKMRAVRNVAHRRDN